MAQEKPTAKPVSEQSVGGSMGLYRIYKRQKKTASNPSGEKLLTITRARDEKDAYEIGMSMIEVDKTPPIRVEAA